MQEKGCRSRYKGAAKVQFWTRWPTFTVAMSQKAWSASTSFLECRPDMQTPTGNISMHPATKTSPVPHVTFRKSSSASSASTPEPSSPQRSQAALARSTRVLRRHNGSSLTSSDGSPPLDSFTCQR